MKKITLILAIITLSFSACSDIPPPPSLNALIKAADSGMFEGFDANTDADIEISSRQLGPFQQVKQLNFIIHNGVYKNMRANVILGQYAENDEWEVIRIMVKDHDTWKIVSRTNKVTP